MWTVHTHVLFRHHAQYYKAATFPAWTMPCLLPPLLLPHVAQPPHTLEASTEIPLSYILTVVRVRDPPWESVKWKSRVRTPRRREVRARLPLTSPGEQARTECCSSKPLLL